MKRTNLEAYARRLNCYLRWHGMSVSKIGVESEVLSISTDFGDHFHVRIDKLPEREKEAAALIARQHVASLAQQLPS